MGALVTRGAGAIALHLVEALLERADEVPVPVGVAGADAIVCAAVSILVGKGGRPGVGAPIPLASTVLYISPGLGFLTGMFGPRIKPLLQARVKVVSAVWPLGDWSCGSDAGAGVGVSFVNYHSETLTETRTRFNWDFIGDELEQIHAWLVDRVKDSAR